MHHMQFAVNILQLAITDRLQTMKTIELLIKVTQLVVRKLRVPHDITVVKKKVRLFKFWTVLLTGEVPS